MGWPGYKGMYSGKIFEYLGLKKNIIIAPGDNDVIDNLIQKTKSGISANSKEEITSYILSKYNEWKTNPQIKYDGVNTEQYSRENQNKKIITALKKKH